MALTKDRNTPMTDGDVVPTPVAAGVEIFTGALVVANASGYAAPGSTATGLIYLGRADSHVDNTAGAAGDRQVLVRRGKAFKWKNSGSDPVGQAALGKTCYVVDDETVSATDGAGTQSAAGTVIQIDANGVWVE
ncbi:hypothetical protein [Arhodomonas sp. AD133]|uniref:hypothetical protein n=1 Tax=Arhodomonas sp. AD133 TaxID=3415009 RepID=UPI003EBBDE5B